MSVRQLLPAELATHPFTARDAAAHGIGEGRLRGPDLVRPFHGVRRAAGRDPGSELSRLVQRCQDCSPLLREGQHFSHLTAARLWGCPLATSADDDDELDVSSVGSRRAPRGRGIRGHHVEVAEMATRFGLPVSAAAQTWLGLASLLPLDELVSAGDHLILEPRRLDPADPRPHATREELRSALAGFSGRGTRNATAAARLIRHGAESRPETLLRLLLVRAGLPEPEVNVEIVERGRSLGWADLLFREWKVVVEYDGDQHRTSTRQ